MSADLDSSMDEKALKTKAPPRLMSQIGSIIMSSHGSNSTDIFNLNLLEKKDFNIVHKEENHHHKSSTNNNSIGSIKSQHSTKSRSNKSSSSSNRSSAESKKSLLIVNKKSSKHSEEEGAVTSLETSRNSSKKSAESTSSRTRSKESRSKKSKKSKKHKHDRKRKHKSRSKSRTRSRHRSSHGHRERNQRRSRSKSNRSKANSTSHRQKEERNYNPISTNNSSRRRDSRSRSRSTKPRKYAKYSRSRSRSPMSNHQTSTKSFSIKNLRSVHTPPLPSEEHIIVAPKSQTEKISQPPVTTPSVQQAPSQEDRLNSRTELGGYTQSNNTSIQYYANYTPALVVAPPAHTPIIAPPTVIPSQAPVATLPQVNYYNIPPNNTQQYPNYYQHNQSRVVPNSHNSGHLFHRSATQPTFGNVYPGGQVHQPYESSSYANRKYNSGNTRSPVQNQYNEISSTSNDYNNSSSSSSRNNNGNRGHYQSNYNSGSRGSYNSESYYRNSGYHSTGRFNHVIVNNSHHGSSSSGSTSYSSSNYNMSSSYANGNHNHDINEDWDLDEKPVNTPSVAAISASVNTKIENDKTTSSPLKPALDSVAKTSHNNEEEDLIALKTRLKQQLEEKLFDHSKPAAENTENNPNQLTKPVTNNNTSVSSANSSNIDHQPVVSPAPSTSVSPSLDAHSTSEESSSDSEETESEHHHHENSEKKRKSSPKMSKKEVKRLRKKHKKKDHHHHHKTPSKKGSTSSIISTQNLNNYFDNLVRRSDRIKTIEVIKQHTKEMELAEKIKKHNSSNSIDFLHDQNSNNSLNSDTHTNANTPAKINNRLQRLSENDSMDFTATTANTPVARSPHEISEMWPQNYEKKD